MAIFAVSALGLILNSTTNTASAKSVDLTATVKDAVSIATGSDIVFDLTPNQFNTGSTDVSVSTTNSTGYTLYVTSSGLDHSGNETTSLIHTSLEAGSENKIDSLSSSAVVALSTDPETGALVYNSTQPNFGLDKWGLYVFAAGTAESPVTDTSTSRTFQTIPASTETNRSVNSSSTQVQEDTTEVTVGAKAGLDILAGTYENVLTFTAVTNSVPYTYTINYDGNASDPAASTVPDATVQIINDDRYPDITISSTTPTRVGYDFLGWATTADGAVAYQPGDTISMDYETPTITLYAKWVAAWDYELTYNANGGSGAPTGESAHSQDVTYSFTVSSTEPTRANHATGTYTFLGWSESSTATTATYTAGSTITLNSTDADATATVTKTLYAVWQKNYNYQLSYNSGSAGSSATNMPSAQTTTSTGNGTFTVTSTVPSWTGHTFQGWATSSGQSSGSYSSGSTYTISKSDTGSDPISATLYAAWTTNNYNVTVSASNASVSPTTVSVQYGSYNTVTVTPSSGYYISGGSCTNSNYYIRTTGNAVPSYGTSMTGATTFRIYNNSYAGTGSCSFTMTSATPAMQDFACSSLSSGASTTLRDSRDSKTYTVKKLVDGKCWMTQNLRLVGSYTLTPSDSNVSSNFNLTATDGFNDYDVVRAYDTGNTSYGAYYNWYTATAGSGTTSVSSGSVSYSICPKNWRLPTSAEWNTLYTAYSSNYTNFVNATGLVLSGSRNGSTTDYQGSYGCFWSSTALNPYAAYNLYLDSSNVVPQNFDSKGYGFSVRCVAAS